MNKLIWTDTDSSNVKRVAHHEATQTLCVEFVNGGLYTYSDVDPHVYVALVHAPSVGQYLNTAVKQYYPYVKHADMQDLLSTLQHQHN